MSGDSGGVILGAALALPVLAVAGAGLLAYGAARATVAIAKGSYDLYKKHEEQVQLQLTSTNAEINSFHQTLDSILQQQASQTAEEIQKAQADIALAGKKLTDIQADPAHVELWRAQIREESQHLYDTLQAKITEEAAKERVKAEKAIAAARDTLNEQLKLQFAAENLMLTDKTKQAQLASTIANLLTQCEAAITQLTARDTHNLISGELSAYRTALDKANDAADIHAYAAALGSGQTLLSEIAALSCTLASREEARWQSLFKAHMMLDSVRNQILEADSITFTNPHTNKTQTLYPDSFLGGRLDELLELVEQKLHQLELAMDVTAPNGDEPIPALTPADADLLIRNAEQVVLPELESLMDEATQKMADYLDRLQCLDVIAAEIDKKTSYQLNWTMPEGGDPSAPITMHLTNSITKDEVTIKLATDTLTGQINMNTYSFGGPDHQISEAQRNDFYRLVVDSLQNANPSVTAQLTCDPSTAFQNSAQTQYNSRQTVAALPPRPAVLLNSTEVLQ